MNFDDTPSEAAFRAEVRIWLSDNAPAGALPSNEAELLEHALAWQRKKADAGYGALTWPVEFGGRGGSIAEKIIFDAEESHYALNRAVHEVGLNMCLPTVMQFGTDAQRQRFLAPGLRGEEIWCQLFSEPGSGSDLAGARTSARRHEDGWVINGQKVWTTGAHWSHFGLLLARTNPDVPKHNGLTMFILDMRLPGVTVRPLRDMSNERSFNEVFFDDVIIDDSSRIGEVGEGWAVAIGTLMFERMSVGGDASALSVAELIDIARHARINGAPAIEHLGVREQIAEAWINIQGVLLLNQRAQSALSRGSLPGPEQSLGKLVSMIELQRMSYLAMELLGERGVLTSAELGAQWQKVDYTWSRSPGNRIAGGTDEILRNIVAERILGLPPEIRPDRNLRFSDVLD